MSQNIWGGAFPFFDMKFTIFRFSQLKIQIMAVWPILWHQNAVLSFNSKIYFFAADNYALILDKTSIMMQQQKSCDYAIMEEVFYPHVFALSMQNNSAYIDVISDV